MSEALNDNKQKYPLENIAMQESTKKRYIYLFNNFAKNHFPNNTLESESDYILLTNKLVDHLNGKGKSTYRQFKAAFTYVLGRMEHHKAIEILHNAEIELVEASNHTSANKKKNLTEIELEVLEEALETKAKINNHWLDKPLYTIFSCLCLTGMRPSELESSEYIQDPVLPTEGYDGTYPVVKIKNGKYTYNRSFGLYRYVGVSQYSKKQQLLIQLGISYAKALKGLDGEELTLANYYEALRKKFARLVEKKFKCPAKSISLYTCRHQFIADLKFSGYSPVEIAAMVGHKITKTAAEHYGKYKHGKLGIKPQANNNDLKRI